MKKILGMGLILLTCLLSPTFIKNFAESEQAKDEGLTSESKQDDKELIQNLDKEFNQLRNSLKDYQGVGQEEYKNLNRIMKETETLLSNSLYEFKHALDDCKENQSCSEKEKAWLAKIVDQIENLVKEMNK